MRCTRMIEYPCTLGDWLQAHPESSEREWKAAGKVTGMPCNELLDAAGRCEACQ